MKSAKKKKINKKNGSKNVSAEKGRGAAKGSGALLDTAHVSCYSTLSFSYLVAFLLSSSDKFIFGLFRVLEFFPLLPISLGRCPLITFTLELALCRQHSADPSSPGHTLWQLRNTNELPLSCLVPSI